MESSRFLITLYLRENDSSPKTPISNLFATYMKLIYETMNFHIRPNIQSMLIYLKDYLKLEFVVSNKFIFSLMEVFVSITFSGTEKMN